MKQGQPALQFMRHKDFQSRAGRKRILRTIKTLLCVQNGQELGATDCGHPGKRPARHEARTGMCACLRLDHRAAALPTHDPSFPRPGGLVISGARAPLAAGGQTHATEIGKAARQFQSPACRVSVGLNPLQHISIQGDAIEVHFLLEPC